MFYLVSISKVTGTSSLLLPVALTLALLLECSIGLSMNSDRLPPLHPTALLD